MFTKVCQVLLAVLAVLVIICTGVIPSTVKGEEIPPPEFPFEADAALLLEPETGEVLYEKNPHTRVYPASITKIMTVLLVMEALEEGRVSLEDEVTISSRSAGMGGTQLFLSPGDRVKLEDLLKGITVGSANDAAVAAAEHLSGSEEKFVENMNQRARELGMTHTRFKNSHGLHHEDHYTTVHDIGLMSRELLKHPRIHEWTSIWMDEEFLEDEIKEGRVYLSNTNRLIHDYQGCDGLKTGFTEEAGHGAAITAQRGKTRFISVVMGAPSSNERYQAAKTLLDYGFSHYHTLPVMQKGEPVASVPVEKGEYPHIEAVTGEAVSLLVELEKDTAYDKQIELPQRLASPLSEGEKIGHLKVTLGEEKLTADLVSNREVPEARFSTLMKRAFNIWLGFGR